MSRPRHFLSRIKPGKPPETHHEAIVRAACNSLFLMEFLISKPCPGNFQEEADSMCRNFFVTVTLFWYVFLVTDEFASLITASQQRLYAYIFSLVGRSAVAWDVLQETNLVLWKKQSEFQLGTRFEAWACTVARYQVMAHLRDEQRDPLCLITPELLEVLAEDAAEVFDHFEHLLTSLRRCREQLPDRSRKMVELYYERGQGLNAVANTLNMNPNAVKQALFRVRQMLRDCIDSIPLPNSP